ncbi:MAG: hypothetical protein AAB518_02345 [Patescibacteria group bacterium]
MDQDSVKARRIFWIIFTVLILFFVFVQFTAWREASIASSPFMGYKLGVANVIALLGILLLVSTYRTYRVRNREQSNFYHVMTGIISVLSGAAAWFGIHFSLCTPVGECLIPIIFFGPIILSISFVAVLLYTYFFKFLITGSFSNKKLVLIVGVVAIITLIFFATRDFLYILLNFFQG